MRQKTKQQLLDILSSMQELHGQCTTLSETALLSVMQDCQDAAFAIGEMLGEEEETLISLLEQYCEEAYWTAQGMDKEEHLVTMEKLLEELKVGIEAIEGVYQIVFFPYKVEMWDSMESVWRACREDTRFRCLVVPIPYFRMDTERKEWVPCYDGDRFPAEVPIVHYQEYSLSNECPEVAFVHNPYDEANLVTTVHPAYYSKELKKYVDKLFYIPYYVTTGYISAEHLYLPVYRYMDYMVVQSEYFKSGCEGTFYYDKVLPFGSPKLDRVVRMCENKPELPWEWRERLADNKLLMLNTSINCLLRQGEFYLRKLHNLFDWLKGQEGIKLVWRPHPLLVSTMQSMRPQLLKLYEKLVEEFEQAKIGVFDTTPDVTSTVALVDGYIGEEPTSIVNLFGAAGKPLFILNSWIAKADNQEEKKRFRIADMCCSQGKWWVVSSIYHGLFIAEDDWTRMEFVGRVEGEPKWYPAYTGICTQGEELFLAPAMAKTPVAFSVDGTYCKVGDACEKGFQNMRQNLVYEESIFYLPGNTGAIQEYRWKEQRWIEHRECVAALKAGLAQRKYEGYAETQAYAQDGAMLWIVALYTNRVLCFHMDTGMHQIYEVGNAEWGYSGIVVCGNSIWLAEARSGKVLHWDRKQGSLQMMDMPNGFKIRGEVAHSGLLEWFDWIVTTPALANAMVRIHKKSGEVQLWKEELFEGCEQIENGYIPEITWTTCFFKKEDGNRLWLQRTYDEALLEMDLLTGEYKVHYPTLSQEAYEELVKGQDGFERPDKDFFAFARRESRLFSIKDFVEELLRGELEEVAVRQKAELASFAANLDGTCGEKVHAFVRSIL
ncbi:MAG: hypothetical protein IJN16_01660 [Lachnospiraceae bacterium]|nr:hypothetical protein [Lachnospiraceae bacterium]